MTETSSASDDLAGLSLPQLFDALAPIDPPPPVSMMPQTPIWAVIAVLLMVGLAFAAIWSLRRYRANAYRREGLAALALAGDDPAQIATVLRRTALAAYPRSEVASLLGPDWVAYLAATGPKAGFTVENSAAVLADAPYRVVAPNADLATRAAIWVRTHRSSFQGPAPKGAER